MGRYYSGDIEGKFWFGIQDSNDPDFFGKKGFVSEVGWSYSEEDIPKVKSNYVLTTDDEGHPEMIISGSFNE